MLRVHFVLFFFISSVSHIAPSILPNGGSEVGIMFLAVACMPLLLKYGIRPFFSAIDKIVVVFLASLVLSSLLKTDIKPAVLYGSYFLIYLLFRELVNRVPAHLLGLFQLTLAVNVLVGYAQWAGFLDSSHEYFTITGFYFNPGPYGIFLATLLAICIPEQFEWKKQRVLILLLAATLPLIIATGSRAALCSLFLVIVIRMKADIARSLRFKRAVIIPVLLAGLFVLFAAMINTESLKGRFFVWRSALAVTLNNPLTGNGLAFQHKVTKHQVQIFTKPAVVQEYGRYASEVYYTFNDYLRFWGEYGAFPLLTILLLATIVIVKVFRLGLSFGTGGIIVLLASAFVSYPLSLPSLQLLFFVCLGMAGGSGAARSTSKQPLLRLSLLILGIMIGTYAVLKSMLYHDLRHQKTLQQLQVRNERLLGIGNEEHAFWKRMADLASIKGDYKTAIPYYRKAQLLYPEVSINYSIAYCYEMLGKMDSAEQAYIWAMRRLPQLYIPRYRLAMFYLRHRHPKWEDFGKQTLNFIPYKTNEVTEQLRKGLHKRMLQEQRYQARR